MNRVNHELRQAYQTSLALALLPFATIGTVLAATAHSVRADQIRFCERYGVVRDRSDNEVPLLPRRSIAYCARSYQTLYQSDRVIQASPRPPMSDANTEPNADRSQTEHSTRTVPGADSGTNPGTNSGTNSEINSGTNSGTNAGINAEASSEINSGTNSPKIGADEFSYPQSGPVNTNRQ